MRDPLATRTRLRISVLTALAFGLGAGPALPVLSAPLDSGEDRAELDATLTALSRATTREEMSKIGDLARVQGGLSAPERTDDAKLATETRVAVTPAAIELADMRVALTQLAIQAGTNDHLTLVRAQTDASSPDAIFVRGGGTDLATLSAALQQSAPHAIETIPGGLRLLRPLIIWSDATLVLKPGEVLELDTASGSLVVSFGGMDLSGATVQATAKPNAAQPSFQPFILSLGEATFAARDSQFVGLGFGRGTLFSGVAVSNRGLFSPKSPPVIMRSTFIDTRALQLEGTTNSVVADNLFHGLDAGGVIIAGGVGVVVDGNAFRRSQTGAALRVTNGARDVTVSDNVLTDSRDTAILIDSQTSGISITHNVIDRATGAGIALRQVTCAALRENLVARGAGTGVRLSDTGPVRLEDNTVAMNAAAGVQIEGHLPDAVTLLSGNIISANRFGLSGSDAGRVDLQGNILTGQLPRLFGGEFGAYLPAFLTAQSGTEAGAVFEIIPPVFLKDSLLSVAATSNGVGVTQTRKCGG